MAVKWYVDEGLAKFIGQWKAAHPGAVVYTIGDASHQSHDSEHNPEPAGSAPGASANEVDAADLMPGSGGVTMDTLRALRNDLMETRDPRLLYLIIDDQIVSSVVEPWKIRKYNGKRHSHLHVSVNDKFRDNESPWDIDGKGAAVPRTYTMRDLPGQVPELRVGDEDVPGKTQHIKRVQSVLVGVFGHKIEIDGAYGPATARAVASVMKDDDKRSSTNGGKLYVPEWRRLLGVW